jgi:uncharacterized membrane protein
MVFAAYPLIPWIGVTAAGYALGQVYRWDPARRRRLLGRLGVALIVGFLVVRGLYHYGDPAPWSEGRSPLFTVLSFLNVTKYPPSLSFLLMTLGPAMLLLRAVDGGVPSPLRPAIVYGRVPMFYYILHFMLIHLLAAAVAFARYGSAHWLTESPNLGNYPFTPPPGWGWQLPTVYLVWGLVVLATYPLCRWFAGVKRRRTDEWLSYI